MSCVWVCGCVHVCTCTRDNKREKVQVNYDIANHSSQSFLFNCCSMQTITMAFLYYVHPSDVLPLIFSKIEPTNSEWLL